MINRSHILVVEDDMGIRKLLSITFEKNRLNHVDFAKDGHNALSLLNKKQYDLIILDVMLPDFSGFDLCKEIRKNSTVPIIFLTACSSDFDKLTAFGIGADDYIVKPFNPLEVVARIKAILNRTNLYSIQKQAVPEPCNEYDFGRFILNMNDASLIVDNERIECTATELNLLEFFFKNPYKIFTTSQIYNAVWGEDSFGEEKTVVIYISKIRKKLKDDTRTSNIIINLRGIGYKFVPPRKE